MRKLKFVILSPRNLTGGATVLHNLCRILRECGYDAVIFNSEVYISKGLCRDLCRWVKYILHDTRCLMISKIFTKKIANRPYYQCFLSFPVKGFKRTYIPFVSPKTVVIYPEIVCGNPLHAKRTVRWFLYHNRYKDIEDAYGKDDLFFTFRSVFNDYDLNPTCRTLHTPYFDLDTYKRTNYAERSGKCYIVRKGRNRPDLPKEFDGPVIDNLSEKEKVRIFNQSEWCISYDTQTAYSAIAGMCGCISVVVPEPGKTRRDYLSEDEPGYGKAFGFSEEEIEFAINTRDKVYDLYKSLNETSKEEVRKFVAVCEEYFKDK